MEDNNGLTTLEILSIAIRSEIDAVRLYTKMKEVVGSKDLKEKMDFLIAQEEKHEKILKEVYEKRFPETKLTLPPKSVVPAIDEVLGKEASLKELFDAGMQAEKMAGEFYSGLAEKSNDMNARSILTYMANMERSHYAILEAEWKQIEMLKTEDAAKFLESDGLLSLGP
ncbi:MAG: ferritin family protein [Candidatus Latescibacterota bacterium]|nr:MAG: ferritin family protein [Candidatus Latescibacterota bacterium]